MFQVSIKMMYVNIHEWEDVHDLSGGLLKLVIVCMHISHPEEVDS